MSIMDISRKRETSGENGDEIDVNKKEGEIIKRTETKQSKRRGDK